MESDTIPKKILVVDDEQVVLHLFERAFKNSGYTILTQIDSGEAKKTLEKEPVDLLITDICMPGVDGLSLAQSAMESYSDIKVIIMTGFGTNDRLLKCIEMDCYGYVDKPFNWDYMKTLISKALS